MVKLFIETSEIYMTLRNLNGEFTVASTSPLITQTLDKGSYEVSFEFATEAALRKSDSIKNSFHLTILIVRQDFITDQYTKQQGSSLLNCDKNSNFPLSMNKKVPKHKDPEREGELIYNYPYIRLSGDQVAYVGELDRYAFRLNETTRFFMTLGSHSVVSSAHLRLADL